MTCRFCCAGLSRKRNVDAESQAETEFSIYLGKNWFSYGSSKKRVRNMLQLERENQQNSTSNSKPSLLFFSFPSTALTINIIIDLIVNLSDPMYIFCFKLFFFSKKELCNVWIIIVQQHALETAYCMWLWSFQGFAMSRQPIVLLLWWTMTWASETNSREEAACMDSNDNKNHSVYSKDL